MTDGLLIDLTKSEISLTPVVICYFFNSYLHYYHIIINVIVNIVIYCYY